MYLRLQAAGGCFEASDEDLAWKLYDAGLHRKLSIDGIVAIDTVHAEIILFEPKTALSFTKHCETGRPFVHGGPYLRASLLDTAFEQADKTPPLVKRWNNASMALPIDADTRDELEDKIEEMIAASYRCE